ncbi:tripartite motif-containing protein 29 isoform X2 [Rana temporaria]|uniref:tripartite motif-containing protein 29 isoform X2 n=1 Tax=Rana temporaria TaxID=8407 RepID=UPI001AAC9032|nr:tripartite motif-containing protein 29 isoform X2 [Rana temporaria]
MEDQDTKATNGSLYEENGSPVKPDLANSSVNDENQKVLINSPGPEQGGVKPSLLKTSPAIGSVKISRLSLFSSSDSQTPNSPGPENSEARRSIRGSVGSMDNDDVLCDSCIDDKKKAVKSCLVCQTSFCEPHLKPHLEGAAFRDHKLLDPIRDFEARKCPLHSKTMELFCQTDQTCICYLCMFQEHKNHNTVTVEAEKYVKETELSEIQEQLHLQLLDVDDEVERWQKEKDRIRNFTANQKSAVDHSFKDLIKELQRQQEEVKTSLEHKERAAVDLIEQVVNDLKVKKEQLQDKQHDGDKLLHTTDAVLFLQEFQIVIRNAPPIPPLPTYTVTLEAEKLTQAMGTLREELLGHCKKSVEKYCKMEAQKNLVERNVENRYMMKDHSTNWTPPNEAYGRFSSLFNAKAGGRQSYQPSSLADSPSASMNSLYGAKGSHRMYDNSFTSQEDTPSFSSSNYSQKVTSQVPSFQYASTVTTTESANQQENSPYNMNVYPMMTRHQPAKALPQTWKSSKQSLLTQQRPFYVNKGNTTNTESP